MKKFLGILCFSFLALQGQEVVVPNKEPGEKAKEKTEVEPVSKLEVAKKLTDKQLLGLFGQAVAQMPDSPFSKLNMTEEELNEFIAGFKKGLTANQEEFSKIQLHFNDIQGLIEKRTAEHALKNPVLFPLDTKIKDSDGKETSIKELLKDNKAVLLDFYASWCGPCMNLMPNLKEKAVKFKEKGVLVAGINTVDADDAKMVKSKFEINFTWLVEPEDRPFSKLLQINSIPRMILVDKNGAVLFNGHPEDSSLADKINKL